MALAANTIDTVGKHPTAIEREDAGVAGAQGADKQACRVLTSPKSTPSPSDFLPAASAMATTSAEATDSGEQSERDDVKEEKPQLGSSLPAK